MNSQIRIKFAKFSKLKWFFVEMPIFLSGIVCGIASGAMVLFVIFTAVAPFIILFFR